MCPRRVLILRQRHVILIHDVLNIRHAYLNIDTSHEYIVTWCLIIKLSCLKSKTRCVIMARGIS